MYGFKTKQENAKTVIANIAAEFSEGISEKSCRKINVGLSILWLFEDYKTIISLLSNIEYQYEYFSTALVHGVALYKMRNKKRIEKSRRIIEYLEGQYVLQPNYKLATGLAYLFYTIWYYDKGTYDIDVEDNDRKTETQTDFTLKKAMEYARKAHKFLSKKISSGDITESEKDRYENYFFYALNILIYFTVESDEEKEVKLLGPYVSKFEEARGPGLNSYWQSRFDDTLAHYYFFLGQSNELDLSSRINYLDSALFYSDASVETIKIKSEHQSFSRFYLKIKTYLLELKKEAT